MEPLYNLDVTNQKPTTEILKDLLGFFEII